MTKLTDAGGLFERLVGPYKAGTSLWTVTNGKPVRRYYLREQGSGHVLAFTKNDTKGYYIDHGLFWKNKAAVLLFMIEGTEELIASGITELSDLRKQLMDSLDNTPPNPDSSN